MNEMFKELLINFSIIFIPILVYQVFINDNAKNYYKKYLFLFGGMLQILLCMLFPISLIPGHSFDLRQVPIITGFLFGGKLTGGILFITFVVIRYMIGGDGFVGAIIVNVVVVTILLFTKREEEYKYRNLILSIFLTLLSCLIILVLFLSPLYVFNYQIVLVLILLFIVQSFVFILKIQLIDMIRKIDIYRENVMKNEKYEVVSHLAASISHEVRNPLTVSRGFIQLLKDKSSNEQKEYIDFALKEMDRATNIINDYLTYAKPHGKEVKVLDIEGEINKIINVLKPLANMNNVEIVMNVNQNFYINGNEESFQQSMINIFKNCIEAMPNGGNLLIELSKEKGNNILYIQDH